MKALISVLFSAWVLMLCGCAQAQTRVVTTEPVFSRAELDQILAPIALYPDTVLSHILIAATYPLEVIEAERWTRSNPHLEAEDAVNAAMLEGWDPSVAALTAFPDLLERMSDDIKWLQNLGDAFLADETRVMDAIQHLREKAYASGQLKKMQHVKVQREKQIIVIEPAVERVVYVPYYDTRVVYGSWWWDSYPPVYWRAPATYVHVGGIYWGPRVQLGNTFFFSSVHWTDRRIVVIDYHHRHHRHPHFYSGRKIAHYQGARRWEHNPVHRRNIVYRSEPVRQRYTNPSTPRRFSNEWRDQRSEQRRASPSARDAKRDRERTPPTRERLSERREQPRQLREHGQERNPKRAQEVREHLRVNRGGEPSRGSETQPTPTKRDTPAVTRRGNTDRREAQQRQEHSPPRENQRNWRTEQRERRQETRQDNHSRRTDNHNRRTDMQNRPERTQQRFQQQEHRRFEPSRSQREGPRGEREQRRFERP